MDDNVVNVAKYIIKNTPIGHLGESVENLKNLVGGHVIEQKAVLDEIATYEEDHFKQVALNEDKIILSKYNKDDENFYHDQSKALRISISPLSDNFEKLEKLETVPTFRDLIDKYLTEYQTKSFTPGITSTNAHFKEKEDGNWTIFIVISSHNINHKNFWSGEWLSSWELDKKNAKNYSLKGTIRANTYYYEEGNIQFNLKSDVEEVLSSEIEGEQLAKDVIQLIETNESKMQVDLDQVYENFSDNYIKPLRRKLPVHGTKMNWSLNQIGLK